MRQLSIKFWVQKVRAAVELYVVLLAAFESFCCGYESAIPVFCQFKHDDDSDCPNK